MKRGDSLERPVARSIPQAGCDCGHFFAKGDLWNSGVYRVL